MKITESLRAKIGAATEQRGALVAELEAIPAAAEAEARSITDDEQARFDAKVAEVKALDADLDALRSRLADLEAIEARGREATLVPTRGPRQSDPFDYSDLRNRIASRAEMRDRVAAALDATAIDARSKEQVDALVRRIDTPQGHLARRVLITGSEQYRSAFSKVMDGDRDSLTDAERGALAEARAASLTDNAGGYAVPFTLDPTIIDTRSGTANPMRAISTIRTTVTDNWNGVSAGGVTASWDGEAAQVSDDAPTLAQPSIKPWKAQVFVPFSIEIGQDWAAMEADVREMFAAAKDDLEAAAFITGAGDGSTQPKGIVTAVAAVGGSVVAPTTAETFAVADLYKVEEALAPRHRARASWLANKSVYNRVRQFGTADSHALWERLGAAQPPQLLGYNAYEASSMDGDWNVAATAANYILLLGDFAKYYIVDRIGFSVEPISHLFGANGRPTGQRGLYGYWRVGGDCVDPNAFRLLNLATTA